MLFRNEKFKPNTFSGNVTRRSSRGPPLWVWLFGGWRGRARYKTRWKSFKGCHNVCPIMRWAKSYSIVDHGLLHGGYFHRLSHEALSLYLFLVVVGDRDGKSYYGERSIADILRLKGNVFANAHRELVETGLISFRSPYFWVRNLPQASDPPRPTTKNEGDFEKKRLGKLLAQLEEVRQSE